MKARLLVAAVVLASIGIGSAAYAEPIVGKTRAQVREELIEAQRNGLHYVTDTSYPHVSPMHGGHVAKPAGDAQIASANELPTKAISSGRAHPAAQEPGCVGPISFCNTYFGS